MKKKKPRKTIEVEPEIKHQPRKTIEVEPEIEHLYEEEELSDEDIELLEEWEDFGLSYLDDIYDDFDTWGNYGETDQ